MKLIPTIADFFVKKKVKLESELVNTIGITNFYMIDNIAYNPDSISIETYRKMAKHYQVAASLAIMSYSIQQIDWFIQADNKTVKKVLTQAIDKIWNRIIRSVTKSFIYGYSPNVKVFMIEKIDGISYIVYKNIKDLNVADVEVVVDKWGNYDGFWYRKGTSDEVRVFPEYSFWYTNQMENGNLYGESLLKNIYKPWWFSEKIHQFANRYYERFGEPLVIGRAPSGASIKDGSGTVRAAQEVMNEIISNIRNHSSVQLPSDKNEITKDYLYELSYLESQMRGYDFEGYLSRLDTEISRGMFLPDLMLGGQKGGSYALGSAQIQAFYTNLMGIMDNIVDYVNLYIIPQLIEYNFEKNKNAKFAYQPLTVDSKKNILDMVMQLIKLNKVKPDLTQLEERSGIKLEEIKEEIKTEAITEKDIKNKEEKLKKEILSDVSLMVKENELDKEFEKVQKLKEEILNG
jgi:hypothetical protein